MSAVCIAVVRLTSRFEANISSSKIIPHIFSIYLISSPAQSSPLEASYEVKTLDFSYLTKQSYVYVLRFKRRSLYFWSAGLTCASLAAFAAANFALETQLDSNGVGEEEEGGTFVTIARSDKVLADM